MGWQHNDANFARDSVAAAFGEGSMLQQHDDDDHHHRQ